MGFVDLKEGGQIRFDEVVAVHPTHDHVWLETKSQGKVVATANAWDHAFERAFISVFPAQPGTVFLTPVIEEDDSATWDEDIVLAWGVRFDGHVTAIGPDGVDDMDRAVLHPNGRVTHGSIEDWRSKDAYLADKGGAPR